VLLEFRASFLPAFLAVANRIAETFGITPSGRPEKTPESIMAKLAREGTRLSRMQDIAGCRIVVPSRVQQDGLVDSLSSVFPDHRLVDRREQPRHGYRAVHVIVREQGRPVEIQVRTDLQHQWANLVEWSASFGGDLKHGVELPGDARLLGVVEHASQVIAELERSRLEAPELAIEVSEIYRAGLFHGLITSAMITRGVDR